MAAGSPTSPIEPVRTRFGSRAIPTASPVRVSRNGGYEPRWSADGRELFYLQGQRDDGRRRRDRSGDFAFAAPVQLFSRRVLLRQPGPARPYLRCRARRPFSHDRNPKRRGRPRQPRASSSCRTGSRSSSNACQRSDAAAETVQRNRSKLLGVPCVDSSRSCSCSSQPRQPSPKVAIDRRSTSTSSTSRAATRRCSSRRPANPC